MPRYTDTSPYSRTRIIDDKYLDILEPKSIPASADDVLYTIEPQYSRRPDLLTYINLQNFGGCLHKEIQMYYRILYLTLHLAQKFTFQEEML